MTELQSSISTANFGGGFWSRLNRHRHSLWFRLTIWNVVAVLFTALITVLSMKVGLRYVLMREIDQRLADDLREIALDIPEVHAADSPLLYAKLERKSLGRASDQWYVHFLLTTGEEVFATKSAPVPRPEPPTSEDFRYFTVDEWRIMHFRKLGIYPTVIVRVGVSLNRMNEDLERLDRIAVAATILLLILAPIMGYWLAKRTTNYLSDIVQTATLLHPEQLKERLPIQGTGDELDQLATTINALLDRVAHNLQVRKDFTANAAHELRTPLAAIRGLIEVALSSDRTTQEYQELLGEVIEQGTSLEALVNQLLLLSESEAELVKRRGERVRLDEIVFKSVDMFSAVADSQGVTIQLESNPPVELIGAANHLRQVLNNLIDNAIKFTPVGGRVTVRLQHDSATSSAELTVEDSGIGIRPDDQIHLFERFFRADNSRTRQANVKGTGLGLSICRAVVEAHGGTIQFRSEFERGTAFIVKLPNSTALEIAAETASPQSESATSDQTLKNS